MARVVRLACVRFSSCSCSAPPAPPPPASSTAVLPARATGRLAQSCVAPGVDSAPSMDCWRHAAKWRYWAWGVKGGGGGGGGVMPGGGTVLGCMHGVHACKVESLGEGGMREGHAILCCVVLRWECHCWEYHCDVMWDSGRTTGLQGIYPPSPPHHLSQPPPASASTSAMPLCTYAMPPRPPPILCPHVHLCYAPPQSSAPTSTYAMPPPNPLPPCPPVT